MLPLRVARMTPGKGETLFLVFATARSSSVISVLKMADFSHTHSYRNGVTPKQAGESFVIL